MCDQNRTTGILQDARDAKAQAQTGAVAEKQYAAQQQNPVNTFDQGAGREPLVYRIGRLHQRLGRDVARLERMHVLLLKHPEFEEFLELKGLLDLNLISL